MADVRPFRALRYDPQLDLATIVCPPFDTISPELQRELHKRSPYNAVHIELALDDDGGRYDNAARALRQFIDESVLRRDSLPAFYLLQQTFPYGESTFSRTLLFATLRVVPWTDGGVLPHEQTFPKHKADRLELMRAAHINGSPVFLFYRDDDRRVRDLLTEGEHQQIPLTEFEAADGQHHRLVRIDEAGIVAEIERTFAERTLYIADGHHRFETALMYRDEVCAKATSWTGDEPENFALVGLVSVDDPGLLVLPTHRLSASAAPWEEVQARLEPMFSFEPFAGDAGSLMQTIEAAEGDAAFGLAVADAGLFVVTVRDTASVDALLPQDRTPEWRALDYALANHAIMGYGLGLSGEQMKDQSVVWFTEDAAHAVRQVDDGTARYAVLVRPVSAHRVLELADSGERMPQKSTFFYPKVPTGLVFNLLEG
ncbi:MAG: DUF1015 domain-containing protein [Dehalococcoidia bacterium]